MERFNEYMKEASLIIEVCANWKWYYNLKDRNKYAILQNLNIFQALLFDMHYPFILQDISKTQIIGNSTQTYGHPDRQNNIYGPIFEKNKMINLNHVKIFFHSSIKSITYHSLYFQMLSHIIQNKSPRVILFYFR